MDNNGTIVAQPRENIIARFDYDKKIQSLTQDERDKYISLCDKLDYHNFATLQTYGADLNSIIAKNGDTLLNNIRSDRSVEVIGYINSLLSELNGFDEEINKYTQNHTSLIKRFFYSLPFVRKIATSLENVMENYNTVAENVDKIAEKISNAKIVALRDNSTLQQIFDNNVLYMKQMRELIIAAKLKAEQYEQEYGQMLGNPDAESYEVSDMQDYLHKMKKRIADMETTEYVILQNIMQIKAIVSNNSDIADKTDDIVNNVIPLWKNQLPMAIILKNQQASIDAQAKIAETTNKLITKTAQDLKVNSINVARASEESIISIETLKSSTQDLITTINEVKRIHNEGEANRSTLESYLQDFSRQISEAVNK